MYKISRTFGYQQACELAAKIPAAALAQLLAEGIDAYEKDGKLAHHSRSMKCIVKMSMRERGTLQGKTEGPGLVSVALLNAGAKPPTFMIQTDLDETPHWMKCGGEDCTCDEGDGECEACCESEGCWFCDGPLDATVWLKHDEAKTILASSKPGYAGPLIWKMALGTIIREP